MSKSIKFKNNIYLDSSGITHNKIVLSEILNRNFAGWKYNYLSDGGKAVWDIGENGVWLFINSHVYRRCILLITVHKGTQRFNVDTIYKNEDAAVPNIVYDINTNTITVTPKAQCRGFLYRITGLAG